MKRLIIGVWVIAIMLMLGGCGNTRIFKNIEASYEKIMAAKL